MAVTTSALLLGATVAVGAFGAYTQYQAGQAEKAMAERNAKALSNQAQQTEWEARENARRQRQNNASVQGSLRARLASQGSMIDSGAPLEILGQTAARLELDVLDKARAANSQIVALQSAADLELWGGEQAEKSANMRAFGTLLSSVGSAASKGYSSYQSGSLIR